MLYSRLRNILPVLIFVLSASLSFAQNRVNAKSVIKPSSQSMKAGVFIDINTPNYPESSYSISQLVKDVLISGGSACSTANVSNVTVSPNLSTGDNTRTWGFFNKGTTNFPFSRGIVLTTGHARKAGNTFQGAQLSDGVITQGDADLAAALGISNTNLKDATYIEFDFVPSSPEITFNYLFASEEYEGNYPCNIGDGFALLLKRVGDPNYTNLAVLPNGTPVSVTNIHPATQAGGQPLTPCGAANPTYFAGYNTTAIETNFSGRTIPLTAQATVIPGETYHFKMVLADYQDSAFDSGVFLEAGSFDIGVQILDPNGVQLPASVNVCDNQPQTFTASSQVGNATYQWFLGPNPIPGATNASYTAVTPGVYKVEVTFPGSSCPGTATVTVVGGTSPTVQNATLTSCYGAGNVNFNLTAAQSAISTTPGATFSFYINQTDANAGNGNFIQSPTTFSSAGNQTLYVVVKNGFCSRVAELQLIKAPETTAVIANPAVLTCANPQTTLDGTASVYPAGSTFTWTAAGGGNIVSGGNTLNPVVNAAGNYTLTISNTYQPGNVACTSTANVTVTGNSTPPNPTLTATKILICAGETVTLTAGGGATYTWTDLLGTGNTQNVTPATTTTYTVSAVGANGCVSAAPATITIEVSQPITVQDATLIECYEQGNITYDLTSAEPQITTAATATFDYYLNLADANAQNGNTIGNPAGHQSPGNQTIFVLVKNGGCSYVVNLELQTTAQTDLTVANPQVITCNTPQITIDAGASVIPAGSTIQWTTAGGNIVTGANTLTPTVNAGGAYTLTVTNITQPANLTCTFTTVVNVVQNTAPPIVNVIPSVPQICPGESVTLTATGGATYNWVGLAGNGNTQVVSPAVTTTYTVSAVGANGCVSAQPAVVTIIVGPPTAVVAASKTKICVGESVTLTANGGFTYNWVGLPGTGNTQTVSPTTTTTYEVFALGGNGCVSNTPAAITIEVVPAIVSTLEDVSVCAGDPGTLDAGAGPEYTYIWSTGETTQTITSTNPGSYSVTISNGTCSKVFTAQIINPELPQFSNVVFEDGTLTITATNPSGEALEYSLDGGVTWQPSRIFYNVAKNTTHNLLVRIQGAKCSTSLTYFTFVLMNAITPNRDGVNDFIDFAGISNYPNFAASIFDRYGAELFKADKKNTIWDGSLKGINLPTGSYWYRVQWENPASKKLELRSGWILLKNRN